MKSKRLLLCLLTTTLTLVSALHRPSPEPLALDRRNREVRISKASSDSFVSRRRILAEGACLQVSGGATETAAARKDTKKVALLVTIPTLAYLLWTFRKPLGAIFSKEKIQSKTLEILGKLDSLPKHYSYASYMGGMAIWEALGLSTIPVETAAGMVFGWNAVILSGSGKLIGAILAFCLGRHGALANWIQSKLASNSFLQLASHSTENNPLMAAFLMKLSSFPETIKNYGAAILSPIKLWMFVLACSIHGTTFSALWTYLGVDTAARLENTNLPLDGRLQFLLGLALFNGIVISPLSMAYWVKTMQKSKEASKTTKKR